MFMLLGKKLILVSFILMRQRGFIYLVWKEEDISFPCLFISPKETWS